MYEHSLQPLTLFGLFNASQRVYIGNVVAREQLGTCYTIGAVTELPMLMGRVALLTINNL